MHHHGVREGGVIEKTPLRKPSPHLQTAPFLNAPRFAAPAHVQSKLFGPARGWRCWSASGARIRADRLVILPTAGGHSGRGDQQRFAGRIMKSPREVLVRSIALSLA